MTAHNARPPPLVLVIYPADGGGYGDHLVASGFRVEEAHTGAQGFDRAVALRPDLVVLDFGLDGDTVARLRREPATSGIPIIALAVLTSLHTQRPGSAPRLREPDWRRRYGILAVLVDAHRRKFMDRSSAPHVLLVDDAPQIRDLFGRFLTRSGMAVTFAEDGVDGLAEARAHVPDAIVCDLGMPRMDGLALCRALRDDPATKDVPILVVSGEDAGQLCAALGAGCDAVLAKPCTGALLVSTIEHLLARLPERRRRVP